MRALEISVIISHCTGARMIVEGRMGSAVFDVGRWNCLDRASALPFLDPGR